jgi:hypothetical protein
MSFSKEVKSFPEDKKVFLLLLFISKITHIHHYCKHVLPFEHLFVPLIVVPIINI